MADEMLSNKEVVQKTEAFADDKLNRKTVAENFKNILLNTDLNVFSVSAQWGGGKTYFIENLIKLMQDDSINILYNAWESDFYDSPLIPLLVELFAKLEECDEKTQLEEDINKSKEFAKKMCEKTSFQIGVNFVGINCSANFEPSKKMIYSEYKELKNEIKNFRNKLKNIQEKLGKKIIIFVDELDRCNPMYAIKTFEIIKHLFGISNIIFVLSIDKTQIENSVRRIFGTNEGEVNGYLRKFIDVDFQLPDSFNEQLIHYHLDNLWDKIDKFVKSDRYYNYNLQRYIDSFGYPRDMEVNQEQKFLSHLISNITSILNFSARDVEKYFMRFNLFLDVLSEKDVLLIEPCLLLNALAMVNMDEFDNYIHNKQLTEYLEINKILPLWNGLFLEGYKEEIRNYTSNLSANNNPKTQNVLQLNGYLKQISNSIDEKELYLQKYPDKIKFIQNFSQI